MTTIFWVLRCEFSACSSTGCEMIQAFLALFPLPARLHFQVGCVQFTSCSAPWLMLHELEWASLAAFGSNTNTDRALPATVAKVELLWLLVWVGAYALAQIFFLLHERCRGYKLHGLYQPGAVWTEPVRNALARGPIKAAPFEVAEEWRTLLSLFEPPTSTAWQACQKAVVHRWAYQRQTHSSSINKNPGPQKIHDYWPQAKKITTGITCKQQVFLLAKKLHFRQMTVFELSDEQITVSHTVSHYVSCCNNFKQSPKNRVLN